MRKGEQTREAILDRAVGLASRVGLSGLTIGVLAEDMRLSKSGLFAHFGSKEALQLGVLQATRERFTARVITPVLKKPRGEPRIRAIFDVWLAWENSDDLPGGCVLSNAGFELRGQPGPLHDFVVRAWRDWDAFLVRAVGFAIEERHFSPDTDPHQFAHDLTSIFTGARHAMEVLSDPRGAERARKSFENLIMAAGGGSVRTVH